MKGRRRKRREIEVLGAVLERQGALRGVVTENAAPIAKRDWETAVGSRIAKRTRPARLDRGVLHVVAASAAWSNELSLLSEPIVANLQRLGVEVRELRFRVGSIEEVPQSRRPAKIQPVPVALVEPLAKEIAKVGDEELRAAIERAARISLAFAKPR